MKGIKNIAKPPILSSINRPIYAPRKPIINAKIDASRIISWFLYISLSTANIPKKHPTGRPTNKPQNTLALSPPNGIFNLRIVADT